MIWFKQKMFCSSSLTEENKILTFVYCVWWKQKQIYNAFDAVFELWNDNSAHICYFFRQHIYLHRATDLFLMLYPHYCRVMKFHLLHLNSPESICRIPRSQTMIQVLGYFISFGNLTYMHHFQISRKLFRWNTAQDVIFTLFID